MDTLQNLRHWQKRSKARTLAAVAVLWLNVAFQACAMGPVPMDNCPHCPAGMHGAATPSSPMSTPMGCSLLDPVDDPDLLKPLVKDFGDLCGPVPAWWSVLSCARDLSALEAGSPPDAATPPLHGPPANVLHCVYLN